jgi:hypothetical protein
MLFKVDLVTGSGKYHNETSASIEAKNFLISYESVRSEGWISTLKIHKKISHEP